MNLYRIAQTVNRDYDTYGGAVVVAASEEAARLTHPSGKSDWQDDDWAVDTWATPSDVTVTYLGTAAPGLPAGVVMASFRAG